MATFLFTTWDGGGNVGPAVAVAQSLRARGHRCVFAGYDAQRARIEERGFAFESLGGFDVHAVPAPAERIAALLREVWAARAHLDQIPRAIERTKADVVVVDCLMEGALAAALKCGVPTAVLIHSSIAGLVPPPQSPVGERKLAAANDVRAAAGLSRVSRLEECWQGALAIATTIESLDPSAVAMKARGVRYVGPAVERVDVDAHANDVDVLVSFSTTRFWDVRGRVRNVLAALAEEPVRVLVSGPDVDDVVALPKNASARKFIAHELVLRTAKLAITHCGHGTVTAALAHGVPIVGLPNAAADQPFLAKRVAELGAGVALDGAAGVDEIRAAARTVMSTSSFTQRARALADEIRALPGADGAADELSRIAGAIPIVKPEPL
jgi:MGT family glycosyltransferase